jgi:N-acetyltransferase
MREHPNVQPTLTGELVSLRPLSTTDWDALYAVAADPLIWEQHPACDRYQEPVFRAFFADALASGGALIAEDRATGEVIGSSRYFGFNPDSREVEIGWSFLARSHWGGRYNGEMKQLMLTHAFTFASAVVFLIGPDNMRSRRAVERIGARQIADRINSLGRTSVVYQIMARDYRSGTVMKQS